MKNLHMVKRLHEQQLTSMTVTKRRPLIWLRVQPQVFYNRLLHFHYPRRHSHQICCLQPVHRPRRQTVPIQMVHQASKDVLLI